MVQKNNSSDDREQHRPFWEQECVNDEPRLFSCACKLADGDAALAADYVQTTFARVFDYLPDPAPIRNPLSYLMRILQRVCFDYRNKRKKENVYYLEELGEKDLKDLNRVSEADLRLALKRLEQMDELKANLATLTTSERLLLKRWLSDWTWEEIAKEKGEDPLRTKLRWQMLVRKLKKQLTKPKAKTKALGR